jgi:crossover junction endodeoxyribonuclease RusA
MADYEFTLPYPPSVNGYWRAFRGRQIISKRGRDYRKHAIEVMNDLGLNDELISERMHLSVVIHPPTLRKYDIDNWCKAPFDALTHAKFWIDDEQIDSLLIKKGEKVKGGLLKVKVDLID